MVELIAVIVILAVVILMAVPIIMRLVNRNKQTSYDSKIAIILKQAKQYARDNDSFLYESDKTYNGYVCNTITVNDLYNAGYLKEMSAKDGTIQNITNPKDGSSIADLNINVYIKSIDVLDKNNKYAGSLVSNYNYNECITGDNIFTFDYTGSIQTLTLEKSGKYKLEVWGAQGGSTEYGANKSNGGYGAYSIGSINLDSGTTLYIGVGGKGTSVVGDYLCKPTTDDSTGYNGGSYGAYQCGQGSFGGGGGATHIALSNGLLSELSSKQDDVLIVAGGGGGSSSYTDNWQYNTHGGNAGGYIGGKAVIINDHYHNIGLGGTQTEGGTFEPGPRWETSRNYQGSTEEPVPDMQASFGQGCGYSALSINTSNVTPRRVYSGAGGGFYGGGCGWRAGAGGGSGYIANQDLTDKEMYCQKCEANGEKATKTSTISCTSESALNKCLKIKNGYARISYIG